MGAFEAVSAELGAFGLTRCHRVETDDKKDRADALHAAVSRAKQRFTALKDAFNAMESAHQRGDYSRSPDLQQRLEEFGSAASEVHRLAIELRLASSGDPDAGPDGGMAE